MRYWLMADGDDGDQWNEFYRDGVVRITGRQKLGDLQQYGSVDEVVQALQDEYKEEFKTKNPAIKARLCFDFGHEVKVGDGIFARHRRKTLLGYGVVEPRRKRATSVEPPTAYFFDRSHRQYPHAIKVRWLKEGTFPGCHAICLADNHRLEPGTRAKDFRILTELKPGFTTGVAKHFLPYDIPPPPEVPYIVRSQLSQLGDLDKYFPTIGPRFAPDTLDSIMAADYLAGIRQLVETARLDARSEFVLELEGLLGRFQNGESRTIMPKATPHTEGALREQ